LEKKWKERGGEGRRGEESPCFVLSFCQARQNQNGVTHAKVSLHQVESTLLKLLSNKD
jgi:hypothetical protein